MRIEIVSKNFKPNENFRELIQKKVSKFDKYFKKEPTAKVLLSISGNNKFVMELTLIADNMRVRSEVTSDNMFDNIDIILPKIEKQIFKYRTKFENRLKKEAFEKSIYKSNEGLYKDEEATKFGKLVRIKNFEIAKSSVESAIEEMELLEHKFFVFLNAETEKVCVVYKRNDGDYGLLAPEY